MGLQLKKQRGGGVRPFWYADFIRRDGKRTVVRIGVRVDGKPPRSGKVGDTGDRDFERSRVLAAAEMEKLRVEGAKARVTKREALRQYVEAVRGPLEIPPLDALLTARDGDARERSGKTLSGDGAKLRRFVEWARERGIETVADITLALAKEYMGVVYNPKTPRFTARTVREIKGVIAIALDRTLPEGIPNPFRHPSLRVSAIDGDQQYHREPLRPAEVDKLLAVAGETDPEARDWIVCGLSTGLRCGDVCRLRWEAVDLAAGALRVKTRKTGAELFLPILPGLADVLARRKDDLGAIDAVFVFPEAAPSHANSKPTNPTRGAWSQGHARKKRNYNDNKYNQTQNPRNTRGVATRLFWPSPNRGGMRKSQNRPRRPVRGYTQFDGFLRPLQFRLACQRCRRMVKIKQGRGLAASPL